MYGYVVVFVWVLKAREIVGERGKKVRPSVSSQDGCFRAPVDKNSI